MRLSVVMLIVLTCAAGTTLAAATTTYAGEATFQNLFEMPLAPITFDGYAPAAGSEFPFDNAAGLTIDGIQFVGHNSDSYYFAYVKNPAWNDTSYNWNSGSIALFAGYWAGTRNYLTIALPAGINAFGLDLMVANPASVANPMDVKITLADGTSYTVTTTPNPARLFWGISSTDDLSSITIEAPGGQLLIDNVYGGTTRDDAPGPTSSTPEVGSFILLGTGLVLLRFTPKFTRG